MHAPYGLCDCRGTPISETRRTTGQSPIRHPASRVDGLRRRDQGQRQGRDAFSGFSKATCARDARGCASAPQSCRCCRSCRHCLSRNCSRNAGLRANAPSQPGVSATATPPDALMKACHKGRARQQSQTFLHIRGHPRMPILFFREIWGDRRCLPSILFASA